MSGICGGWQREGAISGLLAAVNNGFSFPSGQRYQQETDRNAGVGAAAQYEIQQAYRNDRILLACDAVLYNEDELRGLVDENEGDAGAPVAALLAVLYERFGSDFVARLRGDFSIVLWDIRQKQLLAAVDGFGVKRLVYYQDAGRLLIASRIDALLESGVISREVNPRAIARYLNFSVNLAPETIFQQVQRLLPGTMMLVSEGRVRIETYWDMRYGAVTDTNEDSLCRKLEAVVEKAVAAHCKNDSFDTLGAYLSGGTDSSTVTGMMTRTGRGTVRTFSIGFEEQPFNELGYAEIVAKRYQTDHHTYLLGPEECFKVLPDMVRAFDEPFGNSSAIPTYFCGRLAAQNGVKALLAGDGGDELFGGNEWYATDRIFQIYQDVPRALRKGLIEPVLDRLPVKNGIVARARSYVRRSNLPGLERLMSYHFLCAHDAATIFEGDFLRALGGYSVMEGPARYYQQAKAREHLDKVLYSDVKIVLGDSDLPKVTRMSELAGIQSRFPFLDRNVAEFSGCIPAGLKVKGFQKRYLFKRAFRNVLPEEIIKKKKHGFGIPVSIWLKSDARFRELSRDTLLSQRAFERGYFKRDFIEDLFRKHESDDSSYYGDTLWSFLALELWHRQAVDVLARAAV